MQSTLLVKVKAASQPPHSRTVKSALFSEYVKTGQATRALQQRSLAIYGAVYILAALIFVISPDLHVFTGSLLWPGGGFAISGNWLMASLSMGCFGLAMILWFGTGNAAAPPLVWGACALAAHAMAGPTQGFMAGVLFSAGPVLICVNWAAQKAVNIRGKRRRIMLNQYIKGQIVPFEDIRSRDELSVKDAAHIRLLLDRALQPIENFNGFEKLDQFQTASMRYQVNAISYALSMASAQYLPAFSGYMHEAQQKLRAKQERPHIWNYWAKESLWGNFESCPDPIAKDNIMFSGFTGLQMVLALKTGTLPADCRLTGYNKDQTAPVFDYDIDQIIDILSAQYKNAKLGLLPCEPNWVYPLCNAITAAAINGHNPAAWREVQAQFQRHLSEDFLTTSGKLIPFKSSYTGLSMPGVGGAVMQAFPCYFLNAVCPDIALRQWLALKHDAAKTGWKRQLWSVDVGNYNFSQASSYAATALAAREMGDHETADILLEMMNRDCPLVSQDGAAHHSRASLWANAYAFMAKTGRAGGFRDLITQAPLSTQGPILETVDYQRVTVAKAKHEDGGLSLVLYPSKHDGAVNLKLSGFVPGAKFSIRCGGPASYRADCNGQKIINVPVNGRTELFIK